MTKQISEEYKKSLALYNHLLANKEKMFVEFYKADKGERRLLRERLDKELTEKHANDLWEWLNDY